MFIGQHTGRLEAKNRLAFPAKMREELGKRLILTYGFDDSVMIVPFQNWEEFTKNFKNQTFLLPEVRDTELFLYGGATDVTLDNQGRFLLPEYLKEFAKIKKEVVFIGSGNYIRVWSREMWKDYFALKRLQFAENARQMGKRITEGNNRE